MLVAATAKASYVLEKPSQEYRKVFGILEEQAGLAWHVMQVRERGTKMHSGPAHCKRTVLFKRSWCKLTGECLGTDIGH
jgi:hypothetical protein